jgi:hypothetical protein
MTMFWVLVPCGFVGRCQLFGEAYCIHLQDSSDNAGKWRDYIVLEEGRLMKWALKRAELCEVTHGQPRTTYAQQATRGRP